MPIPPKPKRLTIVPMPIVAPTDEVVTARRRTWAGWMDECAAVQDALVEGMLANLPSAHDD